MVTTWASSVNVKVWIVAGIVFAACLLLGRIKFSSVNLQHSAELSTISPTDNIQTSILQEGGRNRDLSVLNGGKLLAASWPEWGYKHALQPWLVGKNNTDFFEQESKDVLQKRLPTVLCIGAKKCGTSALGEFLTAIHPSFKSGFEPHFFDSDLYDQGFEEYRKVLPLSSKSDMVLDKSPRYMYSSLVPGRVRSWNPDVKLIAILCDPVQRAFSDYNYTLGGLKKEGVKGAIIAQFASFEELVEASIVDIQEIEEDPRKTLGYATFHSFVRNTFNARTFHLSILTIGLYYYHLLDWYTYFSPDQLYIVDGENLIKNPYFELKKVEKFLNLPDLLKKEMFYFDEKKGFYCINNNGTSCVRGRKGTTRRQKSTQLLKTEKKLRAFFKPHNKKLFNLLRRKFDWT